jgi:NAD(P)-dependent dehydrogenase (short-subunit alcohol dehydrogenase family)
MDNLDGQIAVVTGAGRGIGKVIAIGLARAGASVAVVARSGDELAGTATEITQTGGRAIAVTADVCDPTAVERMALEVEKSLGPVGLLVNNAGVPGPIGPTWETDPNDWWRCLEVNLRGPMLCSRAVLPGMVARGGGRIVNVASGAGTFAIPHLGAYVTSKTALSWRQGKPTLFLVGLSRSKMMRLDSLKELVPRVSVSCRHSG